MKPLSQYNSTDIAQMCDDGCGFYTDFPTTRSGNGAGRDTSSSRPGSRDQICRDGDGRFDDLYLGSMYRGEGSEATPLAFWAVLIGASLAIGGFVAWMVGA